MAALYVQNVEYKGVLKVSEKPIIGRSLKVTEKFLKGSHKSIYK